MKEAMKQRFKEFKALRVKGMTIGEITEAMGIHKVTANRYERLFRDEGYTPKMVTKEQRYREFKALRATGMLCKDIALRLGLSKITICKYEKKRKAEDYPERIKKVEKWFDELLANNASAGEIARATDTLLKLKAIYYKYG